MSNNKWNAIATLISNGKYNTIGALVQEYYVSLRAKGISKIQAKKTIAAYLRTLKAREESPLYS